MTVFKTFLKVLRKNLLMVAVFTFMLVLFGGLNMKSQDKSIAFTAVKPDVLIVNEDDEVGITKGFIEYIKSNSNTPTIDDNEEARDDALFYNDTDYIIYIPKDFNKEFMKGNINDIDVKKGNNFNASYAEMMISRYLKIANTYKDTVNDQDELVNKINDSLKNDTEIELTTKLDTDSLNRISFFFNFESYSIMVSLIFIIGLMMSIFNSEKIRKRNIISSTSYKKSNRLLLLANLTYSFAVWVIYQILALVIIGDGLLNAHGLIFVLNSFIYMISITSLAFLIGTIVTNKDAINGITNVVGIGASFLCGVFVPLTYLPDSVISIGKFIPTYYYVNSNDKIALLEDINIDTLKPVINNMVTLLIFTIVFIIISTIVAKNRRKIA